MKCEIRNSPYLSLNLTVFHNKCRFRLYSYIVTLYFMCSTHKFSKHALNSKYTSMLNSLGQFHSNFARLINTTLNHILISHSHSHSHSQNYSLDVKKNTSLLSSLFIDDFYADFVVDCAVCFLLVSFFGICWMRCAARDNACEENVCV